MQLINQAIIHRIRHHHPIKLTDTPFMAAVLVILLLDDTDNISIVLTKRTETLATYAGHYSFPGGMQDTHDADLWMTALRETNEELNLPANGFDYIGELDDFHDRYGNLVRPFVASMSKAQFDALHKHSVDEVAEVYLLPITHIHDFADDASLHEITKRKPSYALRIDNVFVWGLTASILVLLGNIIFELDKQIMR